MLHKDEAVHVFTALSSYGEEVSPYFQTVDLKAAIREAQDGVPSNMYDGFRGGLKNLHSGISGFSV